MSAFLGEWLDAQVYLRPSTRATYRAHVERYFIPVFGSHTLSQMTVPMVDALIGDLASRGLSAGTVRRVLGTLRSAMSSAVRSGLLERNPVSGVRIPSSTSRPSRTWTPDEAACFLSSLRDDPIGVLFRLALVTGMRRGELLGLRWSHVHLTGGFLRVQAIRIVLGGRDIEGPPKSRSGFRMIYLDPDTVNALQRLKSAQRATGGDSLVFIQGDGRPMAPWWVSRHFARGVAGAGLPIIRFHDLRHTSATLGLAAGESLKEVSARLGHAGIAITANVYANVLPESARRSTDRRVALMTRSAVVGSDVA